MSPAVELVSIFGESKRLDVSFTALPLRHSAERTVVRFNICTHSLCCLAKYSRVRCTHTCREYAVGVEENGLMCL